MNANRYVCVMDFIILFLFFYFQRNNEKDEKEFFTPVCTILIFKPLE